MGAIPSDICSLFFMAIRFGTSSPSISVTYERMSVIIMTEMLWRVFGLIFTPSETSQFTRREAKLSAANALPRNPESVMAI